MFEPQINFIPVPPEEQPKLTTKEKEVLTRFNDGEYCVHTHLNNKQTHSELGILHSLVRKGVVQYEWQDSRCVAGLVKTFYT